MKNKNKLQINISIFKTNLILPAIVISLGLLLFYNPFEGIGVKSFNRTLGNGMLNGIDITQRITNMSFFNFLLVPLIFFLVYLTISILCKNNNEKSNACIEFINIIAIITLANLIFAYINKFSSNNFIGIEIIFPSVLIVLGIIFLAIKDKKIKLDFAVFKWCAFAAIPITLFAIIMFHKLATTLSINLDTTLSAYLNIGFFIAIFVVLFLVITCYYDRIDFLTLKKAYIPVMVAPIIVSLLLELTNILNQYSIFLNAKIRMTLIIYICSGIVFIGYYLLLKSHRISCELFSFEKYYYPILIVGFALIAVQIPLVNTFNTDFFEQSNQGTAISELFRFGKIPIIQTFDAHMLQNQIGRILYGLLNNDYQGAIFLGYSILPIFIILYYFLFEQFFNKDIAFFLILLSPIISDNTFNVFTLAPIVILSFLYAYKTKKYKAYLLYWTSIAIACLFRLDMGFALCFASMITWGIVWFIRKHRVSVKKLILSCLYVLTVIFVIFAGLCLLKKISPLQRLIEFLKLCQSNVNWAFSSIGNSNMTAFVVFYFIVPSIVGILIIILIFKKWRVRESFSDNKFIIALIIGLLCIFNFSRGIVRHSLVENNSSFIISSAPLFISMFIYIFKKKNKLLLFTISNVIMMIVFSMAISANSIFPKPLINLATSKYLSFEPYKITTNKKIERVIVSDEMKKIYLPLKGVLDRTLLPSETYIDFTNQTLLYAMTGRDKPMYINQSPGLLSGEYTQQKFIEQCEQVNKKVPFILMPIKPMLLSSNLDGIQNSYRYYLVSEYISNNFKPLFRTSNFALWCRKDRYSEKSKLVSKLIEDNKQYTKVKLSDNCIEKLKGHDEKLSVSKNLLILKSTNVDPFLTGLDKLVNIKDTSSEISAISVSIKYVSDKAGLFGLYYTRSKGENFNDKKVVNKVMPKTGVFKATIPYTKDTKIRFDIPVNSTVKIKDISFKEKPLYLDNINPINYNYMRIDYHTYHLRNIPYIWANYDKIGIDKKEQQLRINKNFFIYNFSSIDKQYGNYLLVKAASAKRGTMTVQLGRANKHGFVASSKFDFSLNIGSSQNYLVRLSGDFMWYSGQINAIKITSDNNASINKISILKGDTLK